MQRKIHKFRASFLSCVKVIRIFFKMWIAEAVFPSWKIRSVIHKMSLLRLRKNKTKIVGSYIPTVNSMVIWLMNKFANWSNQTRKFSSLRTRKKMLFTLLIFSLRNFLKRKTSFWIREIVMKRKRKVVTSILETNKKWEITTR